MRIALMGKSGAGKTEASRHLIENHGFVPCKTGPICRKITELLFGTATKTGMQVVSDALITIEPSIFLNAALRQLGDEPRVLIDSLRYRSDYELARLNEYFIIRIVADDKDRMRFLTNRGEAFNPTTDGLHQTEIELDTADPDVTIANDGTVDDLRRKIDEALTAI